MRASGTQWTLISAARGGDADAETRFVAKYREPVVRHVASRHGLRAEAEDIAQEVFVQLFHGGVLQKADPSKGRFRALLIAVTRHVVGSHLQRAQAKKRGGDAVIQPLGDFEPPAAIEPDEEFDREWLCHLLDQAMARLAQEHPRYHEALRRTLLDEATQADAAAAMGCSPAAVRNYVHRARGNLTAYLREEVWGYCGSREELAEELAWVRKILGGKD